LKWLEIAGVTPDLIRGRNDRGRWRQWLGRREQSPRPTVAC